jgi:hypothetical protein
MVLSLLRQLASAVTSMLEPSTKCAVAAYACVAGAELRTVSVAPAGVTSMVVPGGAPPSLLTSSSPAVPPPHEAASTHAPTRRSRENCVTRHLRKLAPLRASPRALSRRSGAKRSDVRMVPSAPQAVKRILGETC